MPSVLFIPPETKSVEQFSSAPAHGARVYDDPPVGVPPKDPDDVYVLYVGISGGVEIRSQFLARRGTASADSIAQMLCSMARAGDPKFQVGQKFTNIIWYAPCHLYIIMDKVDCDFIDNPGQEDFDPLHFHESKPLLTGTANFYYDENRCFYEGRIINSGVVGAPAFHCINHLTDETGKPLYHPRLRTYGFEIRYLNGAGRDVIDPDGQNQGPPHS